MQQLQQGITLQNGKYTIEKVLGQGGFGITYLAEQTMLNRKVAIKEFFLKDLCTRKDDSSVSITIETQADMVERYKKKFTKEAQIIARFDHPNIVHVLDIFPENETWYYVMDYVEGKSLDDIIKEKGHLSEEEALNYIRKIAEALKYIHSFKVNHLDIKPSNIMVRSRDNEPILIDFGISKQYDEKKNETTTTPPGISEGYSPMEQYKAGGVSTFSPQADIYALGATLYKMVAGKTPPSASDVLNDGLPKIEGISTSTVAVIEKAMQPRKVDRPETIDGFISCLIISHQDKESTNDTTKILKVPPKSFSYDQKERVIQSLIKNMVKIEGGTFTMGVYKKWHWTRFDKDFKQNEYPPHKVTIDNYQICKFEVTQEEWNVIMGYNPSAFKGSKLLVENVSWLDTQEFLSKLNFLTEGKFRLPTEAEWEFAAFGGNKSNGYKFSGSNEIQEVAWYKSNSNKSTHEVGRRHANELGLYDMTGNVKEWCNDIYGLYNTSALINPTGASTGSFRICKGGDWDEYEIECRISRRYIYLPTEKSNKIGFRLAI